MEALKAAAKSGNPNALRCALDEKEPCSCVDRDFLMYWAIQSGSLDCVRVLYDKGYEQHRSEDPDEHPANYAVEYGHLEILRFVVDHSGPPDLDRLDLAFASVEMLQYAQELGCVFDEETTARAALWDNLEALRYLHMSGAPWNSKTLIGALWTDSLPCLEYAHMHGCPQDVEDWDLTVIDASLPVLRYVCEHMDPAFAAKALKYAALTLARGPVLCENRLDWPLEPELREIQLNWPLVLYLGRKLGTDLPEALAKARAYQQERAAALAGVFWKADKWQRAEEARLHHREAAGKRQRTSGGEGDSEVTHADAEQMATWEAMARVPKELRERIAVEAHLIIL
jgi:hypothetical protein